MNIFYLSIEKTKTLIFKKKRSSSDVVPSFYYGSVLLENVRQYKYLGIILNDRLTDEDDIDRLKNSFSKCVGSFQRKFSSLPFNLKFRLFNVLCTSFFGSQLWLNKSNTAQIFKKFSVSHHYALKNLLGLPKHFCNHIACSVLNVFTFRHQVNFNILRFFIWINDCKSECFNVHRLYFARFSYFRSLFDSLFFNTYGLTSVLENDIDGFKSRMSFCAKLGTF